MSLAVADARFSSTGVGRTRAVAASERFPNHATLCCREAASLSEVSDDGTLESATDPKTGTDQAPFLETLTVFCDVMTFLDIWFQC